jgi:DNA-binding transcriptional LysR family regulator
MDIDQLRTFDRIAREGSFTKAAARLNVTQATVSMRIRALEEALGGALFDRGRKVRLTERGATFLPYARRMLTALLEGEDALRAAGRGRIAVATLISLSGPLVGPALVRLTAEHPLAEAVVFEGHHRDVAERVHDLSADLAVMGWPNLDPLLDEREPIAVFREEVVIVASPELAAAIGPDPTLERIFAVAPQYLMFGWWQVTPDRIAALRLRARATSVLTIASGLDMVRAGRGAGYWLATALAPELAAGRLAVLRPVDAPPVFRESALVATRPEVMARPLAAALADHLVERAAALGILASSTAASAVRPSAA